jgi:hypothetical protein
MLLPSPRIGNPARLCNAPFIPILRRDVTGLSLNGDYLCQTPIGADALPLAVAAEIIVNPVHPLFLEYTHPLLLSAVLMV